MAVSRRRVLHGTAALAGVALLPTGKAHAAVTQDAEQSQLRMVPGGNGIIYSVQADGKLKWFKHLGHRDGSYRWANGNGRDIGSGWQIHTTVLAAADGQVFGLCGDGTLWWHKWVLTDQATGEGYWAANTNNIIHRGFGKFSSVFGGWDGVFYGVDAAGDIHRFQYLAGDGTSGPGAWANNGEGVVIARGRCDYDLFFADHDGVFYGVRHGGTLDWFRYHNGTVANDGVPITIGSGWEWGTSVERFADAGAFYCVWVDRADPPVSDHELRWYQLANWKTVDRDGVHWNNGNGALVGTGFTVTRTANLQGYSSRWSVPPGQSLDFAVSSTFDSYSVSVFRGSSQVWGPVTYPGRMQTLPVGYRSSGCGWETSFSLDVPSSWKSGFYVARLGGAHDLRSYIPFVVRPSQPSSDIAVLLPFLTHNAYNHWGGHFQYSWESPAHRRTITLQRPFANAYIEPPGHIDVRFHGDQLLLSWLADNGISYDCYQDLDLHSGSWLSSYKVLVLATHPEYWTPEMRSKVAAYLNGGGRVIYTGGNGMYERVDLASSGTAVLHRATSGERWLWRDQGLPETDLLGVAYNGASYMQFAPYEVVADHPFLADTGLGVGSRFGAQGYNFAASGWEVDSRDGAGGSVPSAQLIARGVQERGAEMVFVPKDNGGWVFSVGSLCFNGALAHDPAMARILLNAVKAAIGP